MGLKLREHPVEFGTATFAKSIYIEECYLHGRNIIRELNYTGVCEIEFLFDESSRQYKLIEINARTWLWTELAKVCGVDYAKIIYYFVNNFPLAYPGNYACEKYWINHITDIPYSLIGIIKGKLSLLKYVKSLFIRHKINAVFKKKDFKPTIYYLINIFFYLRHR